MAASSLNYKVVYHIKNSDAQKWLENQQSINLSILKKFTDENIDIPYPTQKSYLSINKIIYIDII